MKRIIESLNEMSFDLPEGWALSDDVYSLPNGQGMINKENYVSNDGEVISLFEVHRDPDDFFRYYDELLSNYQSLTQKYALEKKCNLKVGEFILPTYVIKCFENGENSFLMQVFVSCGDCLACFMVKLSEFGGNMKKLTRGDPLVKALINLLRTVE